jgi:hypothetical protein
VPSSGPATVRAATGAPIPVGFIYVNAAEASNYTGSVGTGLKTADMKAVFQLLVDDVNAHGGVLGHLIRPVYHQVSLTDTDNQISASSCEAFTHDTKVFAVLSGWSWAPLDECLQRAGVVQVSTNALHVTAEYRGLPLVAEPPAIALDRFGEVLAASLVKGGFFAPKPAKIGVLFHDTAQWRTALASFKATLRGSGLEVADEFAVSPPQGETDQGNVAAQMQAAVLRFNTDHITHVLFFERNAYMAGLFALNAEQQQYRPRYGYHSYEPLTNIAANVPASQLQTSMFMGWWPGGDTLDETQYPAAGRECLRLLRSNQITIQTGNEHIQTMQLCESVYFFRGVLTAGGEVSGAGFVRGLARTATSYEPRSTFTIRLDAAHRDGVAGVRMGGYDGGCACFVYRTPVSVV